MINLLRKFRINFTDVTIIPSIRRRPLQSTIREFHDVIEPAMLRNRDRDITSDLSLADNVFITEDELSAMESKVSLVSFVSFYITEDFSLQTFRLLRIREALLEYSRQSSLCVVTLPVPRKGGVSACLYLAWLEMLTRNLPPVLLIRGNQQAVLTFYS